MFRNSFYYQEIFLGSVISIQEDPFKALREGEDKAAQIARALKPKIPLVSTGDIEIHVDTYDPQYFLFPELAQKPITMQRRGKNVPTLLTLRPGPLKEAS